VPKLARWRALATAVELERDFPAPHPEAVAWNKHRERQRIVITLGNANEFRIEKKWP